MNQHSPSINSQSTFGMFFDLRYVARLPVVLPLFGLDYRIRER
jgi:hypothetical protein